MPDPQSRAYNEALIPPPMWTAMPAPFRHQIAILSTLVLVMILTRAHPFAAITDASWAVFFVAGFYLRAHWRWAFPLLIAVAVAVDWYVIQRSGITLWSHYCMSPAYGCLLPAYAALWLGGVWLARHDAGLRWKTLAALAIILPLSVSLCFLISNASFYWLSDVVAAPSMDGWLANFGHWHLPFLKVTTMYVGIAALLHAAALAVGLARPQADHIRSAH